MYIQVYKGSASLNIKDRYQVEEFSILGMGRCKALGSALWGQLCFLVPLKEWQIATSRIPPPSPGPQGGHHGWGRGVV